MLWEVEIRPRGRDGERERVCDEFDLLTGGQDGGERIAASARGFLLEGDIDQVAAERLANELLHDPVVETVQVYPLGANVAEIALTVLLKPGVMDPVAASVCSAAADLGITLQQVRTFRRYFPPTHLPEQDRELLTRKILANEAIEQVVVGALSVDHLTVGSPYKFRKVWVPLSGLTDAGLEQLSRDGRLALTLAEMRMIQAHYRGVGREPSDIELETIAQTWSEHCSHKTLKGTIEFTHEVNGVREERRYGNLLKETIFAATQEVRAALGADDWCVSVFSDNAGVVRFDDDFHACIKVETHNHPSAIEPYGGANTGLGGVIRDPLGTGLGAKPICNLDVFCFAPPDYAEPLPPGVLHPRRVMLGVVAGVRDYGNRMGIPTVNGAVIFDERYLANPLVYCGTVGLIPVDRMAKRPRAGDLIVVVGGRTGRDGIHGATFSSLELTAESESVSGGAVQIGNAITQKKLLDVILQARDQGLYTAITDCGAGGFSSAIGEMGAELGAEVHLEKAPLKYAGLSYTEIWISEAQERMILAVPPQQWEALQALCVAEDVEAAVLGTFTDTGRLLLYFENKLVGDLDMHFLHEGRPPVVKQATYHEQMPTPLPAAPLSDANAILKQILGSYSVCSKEWIIRQYDHEVQGGSVVKPLTGAVNDGPSDAAVILPVLGRTRGLALGNGINPLYGDADAYAMAAAAIDEAIRNVVAVGADPERIALLDNFCWGNVNDPQILGGLVRTAEACRDVAIAYRTPFVSGKDSLNNQYRDGEKSTSIPGTLLVTALGIVPDVRQCVTMDLKEVGNELFLIGTTRNELGGSHLYRVTKRTGGIAPKVDVDSAPRIFRALHTAIRQGLIRACHDLSEGGAAVALAEMAFAGGIGADITDLRAAAGAAELSDEVLLFSESPTRFVVEVRPSNAQALRALFAGLPVASIGRTVGESRLRIAGASGEWLVWAKLSDLKEAWQKPLRW